MLEECEKRSSKFVISYCFHIANIKAAEEPSKETSNNPQSTCQQLNVFKTCFFKNNGEYKRLGGNGHTET